jgi:peroxiredoxin
MSMQSNFVSWVFKPRNQINLRPRSPHSFPYKEALIMRRIALLLTLVSLVTFTATACSGTKAPTSPTAESSPEPKSEVKHASAIEKLPPVEEQVEQQTEKQQESPDAKAPSLPGGTPAEAFRFPQPPLEMPQVLLTQAQAHACRVRVGDAMPDLKLPDLNGKPQQLSQLRGQKLTVLTFWNSKHPYAVEEIADLGPFVTNRFADQGVKVVGVSESDTANSARKAMQSVGADFVNLVDPTGAALAQVGTPKLPRTYLLDDSGKILWFDIEYSRSTRRDLLQAIDFALNSAK